MHTQALMRFWLSGLWFMALSHTSEALGWLLNTIIHPLSSKNNKGQHL